MATKDERALEVLVHDVKTPLATIRALTQLSAVQLRRKGDEAAAARLDKVDAQIERIRALLQAALDEERQRTG